jgi:hypothetical protein
VYAEHATSCDRPEDFRDTSLDVLGTSTGMMMNDHETETKFDEVAISDDARGFIYYVHSKNINLLV